MALLKHFQLKNQKQPLPDPNGALPKYKNSLFSDFLCQCVCRQTTQFTADSFGDRGDKHNNNSRGLYMILMPAQKFEMGKRAAEVGSTAAMRYYAKNYPALELNVCSMMHCM